MACKPLRVPSVEALLVRVRLGVGVGVGVRVRVRVSVRVRVRVGLRVRNRVRVRVSSPMCVRETSGMKTTSGCGVSLSNSAECALG